MDDEAIARRRALNIPVHVTAAEHEWRSDGFCNCGESKFKLRGSRRATERRSGATGASNLDRIEHNPCEGH